MSFQPPSGPPPAAASPQAPQAPQAPASPADQPAFPFVDPSLRRSQDQGPPSFLAPVGPPPGGPGFVVPRSSNRSPSPARQGPPPASPGHTGGSTIQDTIGSFEGCFYKIDHRDSNSLLSVTLQQGYALKGKSGSMVAMAGTVQIQGKMKMSFKKFLTGGDMTESIFTGPGEVMLAPEIWGDIVPIKMDGQTEWNLSKDAFLAATQGVVRTTKSQGFSKGLFSGEGFFVAKASGVGMMFIQSLGAIVQKQLQPGEQWIVDNGHLVAWTAKYQIERIAAGGFFSGAHTGEGLVCRFTGPGTIYIQTRNPESLVGWIAAQMPAQSY